MKLNAVTRRSVILSAAGSIAATAIPSTVRAAGTATRKNIDALSAPELDAYKHAVQILKDRSSKDTNDPTGYDFWASLHDSFDDTTHSGCAHYSEKFFPWHRRYLYDFEALLQQTDPPVTGGIMIPYWDWSQPPKGGGLYPQPFLDTASPLYDDSRYNISPPPWNPANLRPGQLDIPTLIKETDWNLFAGKPDPSNGFGNHLGDAEGGPHNTLHSNISYDMQDPQSAVKDPIFWSFHAGIDLMWARWQRLHVPAGTAQTFADGNAIIWFRNRSYTVASTAKTTDFGYEYDYDFGGDGPPAAAALLAQGPGITSPAKRTLALTTAVKDHDVTAQTPASGQFGNNTLIRLAGLRLFHDKSYRLVVYLHPKEVTIPSLTPDAAAQYRIREITLWRGHHDAEVETYVRPTPEQLAHLNQGWELTLQSEAVPIRGGPPMTGMAASAPLPATSALVKTLEIEER
jgi:hypothetical protein